MKKVAIAVLITAMFITVLPNSVLKAESTITITSPSGSVTVLPEADDYATLKFSDPWNMSNREDAGLKHSQMGGVKISSGKLYGTTKSKYASFWPQWGGYPGSYPNGREGAANKINSSVFKRFTFKMYLDKGPGTARLWWFRNQAMTKKGYVNIPVKKGWNIYSVNLPSSWYGWIIGLRFDPINITNTRIAIDWMRLTRNKTNVNTTIAWNDEGAPGTATIYLDNVNTGYKGAAYTQVISNNGSNSKTINTSGLEPGRYYVYIKKGSDYSAYSQVPFRVNQSPIFSILNPDKTGGVDWATRYVGAWDMRQYSDLSYSRYLTRKKISGGIFSAYNTNNDSFMHFQTGRKYINTDVYRYLSFKFRYDGAFSLRRGTMSRIVWKPRGTSGLQVSDDIVTYDNGWHTYTIDMKKIRLDEGRYGWRGYTNMFRFDPNEDPISRKFYIAHFKLAAIDKCSTTFDIRYMNRDTNDSKVTLSLYYDKDRRFGNGNERRIVTKTIGNGTGYYRWRPSKSLRANVWIYARLSDGKNTVGYYSTGMLRVH